MAEAEQRSFADGGQILDLLEGVLYYRLLWRYAPLVQADLEATIVALLHGAAP